MVTRRQFIRYGVSVAGLTTLGMPMLSAKAPGPAKPLRIVYFTDVHATPDWGVPEALKEAATAINAFEPDLILGGGDFIHRGMQSNASEGRRRFDIFENEFLRRLEAPTRSMIGNHDHLAVFPEDGSASEADPKAEFCQRFELERPYHAFTHGRVRFILLDSIRPLPEAGTYAGDCDDAQWAWLEREVSALEPEQPVVLGSHIPFRSTLKQHDTDPFAPLQPNLAHAKANDILALFAEKNLLLVLQGHLHLNEEIRLAQQRFIMGGAISGAWWRGANHGTPEGFGLLTLHPDHATWDYHSYSWRSRG